MNKKTSEKFIQSLISATNRKQKPLEWHSGGTHVSTKFRGLSIYVSFQEDDTDDIDMKGVFDTATLSIYKGEQLVEIKDVLYLWRCINQKLRADSEEKQEREWKLYDRREKARERREQKKADNQLSKMLKGK